MRIQTFTIVTGTSACNAKCPYCISKMTPKEGITYKEPKVNWVNFDKACRLAQMSGVTTVLITGKGEPTLYPDQITKFLEHLKKWDFPLIELQTNGLILDKEYKRYENYLKKWRKLGLNTLALSIVHYKKDKNKLVYTPDSNYINLNRIINKLHNLGFSIRLSCMMAKGFIDSIEEVKNLCQWAKRLGVEQLTVRAIKTPKKSETESIFKWTKKHALTDKQKKDIANFLEKKANKLMTLEHGAIIYDLDGQNICLADCLTLDPKTDYLRQLIFFPDGHLRYDWQFKGAILLGSIPISF